MKYLWKNIKLEKIHKERLEISEEFIELHIKSYQIDSEIDSLIIMKNKKNIYDYYNSPFILY